MFTGRPSSPPISTFLRSATVTPVSISEVIRERAVNIETLQQHMEELHPIINSTLQSNRQNARNAKEKGVAASFTVVDYVLVAREEFFKGEKLCLRWRGPRRVVKALNEFVYQVEDMRNGTVTEVYSTRLKHYSDESLDKKAILEHAISSEHGMPVGRLLKLMYTKDGLGVLIRWKGLPPSEDTVEPIQ